MPKYSEMRDKLKTGDMLLYSSSPGLKSRHDLETHLVKMATQSQWTHVGVVWAEHNRVFVMDLTTKGCAPRPISDDLKISHERLYVIPSPKPLSEAALLHAFSRFGQMTYSKWEAVLAGLKRLVIGDNLVGECAEFALEVYGVDGMAPTNIATPYACMVGALSEWEGATLIPILND